MCGLAGYFKTTATHFEADARLLKSIHKSIEHRGPDGHGVWVSKKLEAAFVHRRLSIIDLSTAGIQPMFDQDKSVIICFNGEIYNYKALRKELEVCGHNFKSNSDTEVFLYAFKEWGIECLEKLEGMFAGVLGDLKKNEWYLIRDRIGIKPLYFSLDGGYISFASEIKALWQLPWLKQKLNQRGLYHYLTYMVTPAPMTLYQGVYKMPSGYYAKIDSKREITFHEWYNPLIPEIRYDQKSLNNEQFCVDTIRTQLTNSIEKRMQSDVPFGVFLSGGVDSSLNVALMSQFTDRVKTFNVAFSDGPEYAEVEWARKVAKQFNTEHHEISISEKEAFEFFEKMVHHQDEPIADCVCVPLYYVSKLLKDSGTTVVQVGEGSDELYCGYQNYANYLEAYRKYYQPARHIPRFVKKSGSWLAAKTFPSKKYHLALLEQWASNKHLFWSGAMAFSEEWKQSIMPAGQEEFDPVLEKIYPGLDQRLDSYAIVEYHLKKLYELDPTADFLKSMTYLEFKQRLPELLLMRVDKMTMATSVEGRVPFLDHKHVEFAFQVPSSLKYKNKETKYILKKAAEGILPNDVIYRKKMGFAAPISRWFKSGKYFKPYFNDMLQSKKQSMQTVFGQQEINRLMQETQRTDRDYSVQLWVLQNVLATQVFE
jgi:asparagine synthase (glutamine-hydrolysing)